MKKNFFVIAALCASVVMSSCSDDNGSTTYQVPGTVGILTGDLTESKTLEANSKWTLSGAYRVVAGGELIINEGVEIIAVDDSTVDFIIVSADGKISAKGTSSAPIVMTSELKEHGAWGGIHICGDAAINQKAVCTSEVGDMDYGTPNTALSTSAAPQDPTTAGSRVVLEYIAVEYAGYSWTDDKEANGFTFYGVSSKDTYLNQLVAYKGSDDGFEWFGGDVNATNLYSIDNEDDAFDWTYGYTGTIENAYAQHLSSSCDHLIEGDSDKTNPTVLPISCPIFKGVVTLIGKDNADGGDRGLRIRRGSHILFSDAAVTVAGKSIAFDIVSETSNAWFTAGDFMSGTTSVKAYYTTALNEDSDKPTTYTTTTDTELTNAGVVAALNSTYTAGISFPTWVSALFSDVQ